MYTDSVGHCKMLLICSTLVTKNRKVQIISGNYFHQHNDGDAGGDKACGDGDVISSPCHS